MATSLGNSRATKAPWESVLVPNRCPVLAAMTAGPAALTFEGTARSITWRTCHVRRRIRRTTARVCQPPCQAQREPPPEVALRGDPHHEPVGVRPLGRLVRQADRTRRRAPRLRRDRADTRVRLGVLSRSRSAT